MSFIMNVFATIISTSFLNTSLLTSILVHGLSIPNYHQYPLQRRLMANEKSRLSTITVSVDELEKDLTPSERDVVGVVRKCGPSVAYVTSILPSSNIDQRSNKRSRRGPNGRDSQQSDYSASNLPRGNVLGSGSGFVVSPGYLCTNFHVIERAYSIQKNAEIAEHSFDALAGNLTGGLISHDILNITKSFIKNQFQEIFDVDSLPAVYVKISSSSRYQKCCIVDVNTDIDLAVLKILDETPTKERIASSEGKKSANTSASGSSSESIRESIPFGSSSDLLVGQTVVAIGSPFGLQSSATSGIVSAVNREFRAGTARTPANTPIRNVIQMDAAINPGNSGGPLLNLKGEMVGINTAIVTTSGSSAGIGFAVPADQIEPVVKRILRNDRSRGDGNRRGQGWLGVSVIRQEINAQSTNSTIPMAKSNNWVAEVERKSPAYDAGIRPLVITQNGTIEYGDAIIAVGGNEVANFEELQMQLENRVVGEQVALTVQNADNERRVVYVTLSLKPEYEES